MRAATADRFLAVIAGIDRSRPEQLGAPVHTRELIARLKVEVAGYRDQPHRAT
jgi:hypothetical protein